jgi:hypothetical protein
MKMTDAEIYVSITDGNKSLILDGNLCLFGDLINTLQGRANDSYQVLSHSKDALQLDESKKEEKHVEG